MYSLTFSLCRTPDWASTCGFVRDTSREIQAPSLARHGVPIDFTQPGLDSDPRLSYLDSDILLGT